MEDVLLGIGSNVGNRVRFLAHSVQRVTKIPGTRLIKASGVYETEPVGVESQSLFLNAAVWVQTSVDVREFHRRLKSIETELGRRERVRWGPREIDIDILLFGNSIIREPLLTIPHPELVNRKFVLQPLAEIASSAVHPLLHKSVQELLDSCVDTHAVGRSVQMTEAFITTLEE